jgi:hypothetical protein
MGILISVFVAECAGFVQFIAASSANPACGLITVNTVHGRGLIAGHQVNGGGGTIHFHMEPVVTLPRISYLQMIECLLLTLPVAVAIDS